MGLQLKENEILISGLRKVYPYYFTFTTFTKGRWVGEKILDVFAREFRAQPAEEYERCIKAGTLSVNQEKVSVDYQAWSLTQFYSVGFSQSRISVKGFLGFFISIQSSFAWCI